MEETRVEERKEEFMEEEEERQISKKGVSRDRG